MTEQREHQWWHFEQQRRENNGRHEAQCRCGECERRREDTQRLIREITGK